MKTQTPHTFYKLGSGLRYLLDIKKGSPIKGNGRVHENLQTVIRNVEGLQLPVSLCAIQPLRKLAEATRNAKDSDRLDDVQARDVANSAKSFREVINAELKSLIVYAITPKKYPSDKLIGDMAFMFPNGIYDQLSPQAQYDVGEAGKCICFERATAAAFHLLRATEETLKGFYLFAIKHNRADKLMMGPIIQDLRQKRKTKHLHDLVNCLDNIRSSYRNPTQHPEKIYDMDEAQALLGLCVDAMTKLIKARGEI